MPWERIVEAAWLASPYRNPFAGDRMRSRLLRETIELTEVDDAAEVDSSDPRNLRLCLKGALDSMMEGIDLVATIRRGPAYPFHPPEIKLLPLIFHPLVDNEGGLRLNTAHPSMRLPALVRSIIHSMAYPASECLVSRAGVLLREDPILFRHLLRQRHDNAATIEQRRAVWVGILRKFAWVLPADDVATKAGVEGNILGYLFPLYRFQNEGAAIEGS